MVETIWCEGHKWLVSEYNKKLSEENQIADKYEEKIKKLEKDIEILEKERDDEIEVVWKK